MSASSMSGAAMASCFRFSLTRRRPVRTARVSRDRPLARMISAAEAAYARWADFTCVVATAMRVLRKYDAICFNGALWCTLRSRVRRLSGRSEAERCPRRARHRRAHQRRRVRAVREGREPCDGAVYQMPTFQELKEIASGAELEVAPWDGMSWETMGDDAAAEVLDDFYFAVLRRPQQAQTTVKFEI